MLYDNIEFFNAEGIKNDGTILRFKEDTSTDTAQ